MAIVQVLCTGYMGPKTKSVVSSSANEYILWHQPLAVLMEIVVKYGPIRVSKMFLDCHDPSLIPIPSHSDI
jgi:hypothetical protein